MGIICTPYHSVNSKVYHIYIDCTEGNNIEIVNRRVGKKSGLKLCEHCETMVPEKPKPYHALKSKVHHIYPNCTEGNNIEVENRRKGDGGRRLCNHCRRMKGIGDGA